MAVRKTRRAFTSPGFHEDTRAPEDANLDAPRVETPAKRRGRYVSQIRGSGGSSLHEVTRWGGRKFTAFVPDDRYKPSRLPPRMKAEVLRLVDAGLDERVAEHLVRSGHAELVADHVLIDAEDSVPVERFERPPAIDTGTWGLLLAIDVRGEKLADALKRMGITKKAHLERMRKRVQRARETWAKHRAQVPKNTALSQNQDVPPRVPREEIS